MVAVETADLVPDGWEQWLHWSQVCADLGRGYEPDADLALLRADVERTLGTITLGRIPRPMVLQATRPVADGAGRPATERAR